MEKFRKQKPYKKRFTLQEKQEYYAQLDPKETLKSSLNHAYRALERSDKTEQEICTKLASHGIGQDIIEQTIIDLKEYGYLNDERYAERFVEIKRQYGWGNQKISQALYRKGIPQHLIKTYLTSEDPDIVLERAQKVAEKFLRSQRTQDHNALKRRLMGKLMREGFGYDTVSVVTRRVLPGE